MLSSVGLASKDAVRVFFLRTTVQLFPETSLQLEAQPPARIHTRTDKSRSSGGHDFMRQGDDILAKGAVRVEHSAPRQHVGMVGDILAVVAFDHGD